MTGYTSVDNNVGFFGISFSPASASHLSANKFMSIKRSAFVGSSSSFDCSLVFVSSLRVLKGRSKEESDRLNRILEWILMIVENVLILYLDTYIDSTK